MSSLSTARWLTAGMVASAAGLLTPVIMPVAAQAAPATCVVDGKAATTPRALIGPACVAVGVRKEVRDLSSKEWSRFRTAAQRLHADGHVDRLAKINETNADRAYDQPMFLAFNRRLLLDFERTLQRYDPQVQVPYWDWSRDFAAPHASPVLTTAYFGGNGQDRNHCVTDGVAANWIVTFPARHCLRRDYDNGSQIRAWPAPESIANISRPSQTYNQFRQQIETIPWAAPHLGIGGDMATQHAPNDPLEWIHRAFIDRLWARWQTQDNNILKYDGTNPNGTPAAVTDLIPVYDEPVRTVMHLGLGILCYGYANQPRDGTS